MACEPEVPTGRISAVAAASRCSIPQRIVRAQATAAELIALRLAIGPERIGRARRTVAGVIVAGKNRREQVIAAGASRHARVIALAAPARQTGAGVTAPSRCSPQGLLVPSPRVAERVSQVPGHRVDPFRRVAAASAVVVVVVGPEVAAVDGALISR